FTLSSEALNPTLSPPPPPTTLMFATLYWTPLKPKLLLPSPWLTLRPPRTLKDPLSPTLSPFAPPDILIPPPTFKCVAVKPVLEVVALIPLMTVILPPIDPTVVVSPTLLELAPIFDMLNEPLIC